MCDGFAVMDDILALLEGGQATLNYSGLGESCDHSVSPYSPPPLQLLSGIRLTTGSWISGSPTPRCLLSACFLLGFQKSNFALKVPTGTQARPVCGVFYLSVSFVNKL